MRRVFKPIVTCLLISVALVVPNFAASQIPIPVPMPMDVQGLQNMLTGQKGGAAPSAAAARDSTACETGGIMGGLLGNSIFKGSALGTAAGAAGGCLVARSIARELTKNERDELQAKTEDLFDSSTPTETYQSEEKQKTVTITRGDAAVQPKTWQIDALANVTPPHDGFDVVGKTYHARKKVNLRAFSSAEGEVIGSFRQNEAVFVMGRTYDGAWNLIGSDNVLVGYASTSLFSSSPVPTEALKAKPAAHVTLPKGQSVADAEKTKVSVNTSTTCTQVRQQVGNATGLITGCKSPNGGWNLS